MPEMMPSNLSQAEIDQFVRQTWEALQKGDLAEAHAVARQGREAGVEHAFLLKAEALHLHDRGDYQAALTTFHHARMLTPQDASILNGIAACLAGLDENDAALKVLDESLLLDPNASSTHYLRGWIFERALDFPAARQAYEQTAAINPRHQQAIAGLATIAVQQGDFQATRTHALRALALNPAEPAAAIALARTELAEGNAASAETRLRALLTNARSPRMRGLALSVLGDALDVQDRPAEAFEVWQDKAKELQQQLGGVSGPSAAEILAPIAKQLETIPREKWDSRTEQGEDAPRAHVFVLGFLRSGTTLLQQILATASDAVVVDERGSLRTPGAEFMASPGGLDRLASLPQAELEEARAAYWQKLRDLGLDPRGRVVIDKDPLNTINLPVIAKLFPRARVLYVVRDPRDVVLSCFRRSIDIVAAKRELTTLAGSAEFYAAVMNFGETCRRVLPPAVQQIRYEDIVEDFGTAIRQACEFTGVEWKEAMRDFSTSARSQMIRSTLSAHQVRQPLYRESAGAWRRFAKQLAPVLPTLAPWVTKFGYPDD